MPVYKLCACVVCVRGAAEVVLNVENEMLTRKERRLYKLTLTPGTANPFRFSYLSPLCLHPLSFASTTGRYYVFCKNVDSLKGPNRTVSCCLDMKDKVSS